MERLRETLNMLRRGKRKRPNTRICPRCGKANIRPRGDLGWGILPVVYMCQDCGYTGHLVVELEEDNSKE